MYICYVGSIIILVDNNCPLEWNCYAVWFKNAKFKITVKLVCATKLLLLWGEEE